MEEPRNNHTKRILSLKKKNGSVENDKEWNKIFNPFGDFNATEHS